MELMSSLLFYAFVAVLPQALGSIQAATNNKNKSFSRPGYLLQKKILLNLNGPPLVTRVSKLHGLFTDSMCSQCISCMERAVKEHKMDIAYHTSHPTAQQMQDDLLTSSKRALLIAHYMNKRTKHSDKRLEDEIEGSFEDSPKQNDLTSDMELLKTKEKLLGVINSNINTLNKGAISIKNKKNPTFTFLRGHIKDMLFNKEAKNKDSNRVKREKRQANTNSTNQEKIKNGRKRKSKVSSIITVTKYNINGRTYALKVKEAETLTETISKNSSKVLNNLATCTIYKVVNTFTCGSLEGDLLLSTSKSRSGKNKKGSDLQTENVFEGFGDTATAKQLFHKRDIVAQVSKESYISSVEEY